MPMSASEIGSNFQSDGFAKAGGSGGPGAVGGQFNVKEATQVSIDKSLSFGIRCTCSLFTFLQLFVYLYPDIIIFYFVFQIISNSSTCTLKFESSGGPFKNIKNNTSSSIYTVQFNKETTKRTKTTSSEVNV